MLFYKPKIQHWLDTMGDRANLDKQHFYEHPNSCGLLEIFRNDILAVKVAVTPDVDKAKTHSEFM
ncbi:MAG: hypothetical protein RMX68_019855 [Aulosira sp. ZfuVER01]|nr:hypothetical protein [Aulosira sp. ZfuVER01]MDZ8002178.1 hypothetical protein [Aulosira sp. DedVER01a]MDZ8056594.1 hypothetical protein [Aulosira sp. ZfuCHP01]